MTAQELINAAAYAAGILGQADAALTTADSALALGILQRMLDSWSVDGLMVYALTEETITLTAADGSYTTANLSTATRPMDVRSDGFVRMTSGVDYPLRRITRSQWNTIGTKTTQGIPEVFLYEPAMTAGTFEFYPVPSEAMVAYLNCQRALTGTLSGGTSVATPPGYDKAIVTNLAVELGFGGFGAQPTQSLVLAARESKMLLENMNYRPLIMDTIMSGDSDYDIRAWP